MRLSDTRSKRPRRRVISVWNDDSTHTVSPGASETVSWTLRRVHEVLLAYARLVRFSRSP